MTKEQLEAKPNTINWLAKILTKAQGVLNTETGGTVNIGHEVSCIRREYDRLTAENERLREILIQRENEIDDLNLAATISPAETRKP